MNKDDFRLLPPERKAEFLKTLGKQEQKAFLANPDLFLFPKQVIEGTNRYILLRCGRRFGKSWSGGAYIAKRIYQGARVLGLCGPTYNDVANIMVPSIQRWFYGKNKPVFNNLRKALEFKPDSEFPDVVIHCFTSDKEIRGYGLEALWCDEVGAWLGNSEQIKKRFYSIDTCVSEGKKPQTIITTTPITIPLFHEWKRAIDSGDHRFKLITGTMFDNPYLSEDYRQSEVAKYAGTRLGRQELFGEQLEELEGALFTKKIIDAFRDPAKTRDDCLLVVISVDPAVTSTEASDETGITVQGLTEDKRTILLADLSGRYSPTEWSDKVFQAWNTYGADFIVAEKNNGGDLIKSNITVSHPQLEPFVKLITAYKSKLLRAEPVANLMEKGRIIFSGEFPELEKQLIEYCGTSSNSPDRMDAFVYGVTELLIKNQDLNVFKPLLRSANLQTPPVKEYVYTLGLNIKPNNTTFVLGAYSKNTKTEHLYYLLDYQSGPMNLSQIVEAVRKYMAKQPIVISCTKEYAEQLRKYNLPVKETTADPALLEAINSDIAHDRIRVCNGRFDSVQRLLRTFQYDGSILHNSGNFVLLQEDDFIKALLNSFSQSHHFVHKTASTQQMTEQERMVKEIYRTAQKTILNQAKGHDDN